MLDTSRLELEICRRPSLLVTCRVIYNNIPSHTTQEARCSRTDPRPPVLVIALRLEKIRYHSIGALLKLHSWCPTQWNKCWPVSQGLILHEYTIGGDPETRGGSFSSKRRKDLRALPPPARTIPFSTKVLVPELLHYFKFPNVGDYDGTGEAEEHLLRFENAELHHQYADPIKCRVFLTTLVRSAQ
ncbi:hypothetical protein F511_34253 [Dorcoceras hygrometricum]|uniref:Uncharacterized protein n=1 Tax=Dorcoceras hygrometricum TaxID=472368 RepID=A0A2Z7D416_9LAMI|nr:hypothetical protein F511_34253 [Dorcoceras hygrometricum]